MKTLLSLGHGYSAAALAARLIPLGWQVIGTIRRPEKAASLAALGVTPLLLTAPGARAELQAAAQTASHILISAGPENGHDPFLATYPDLAKAPAAWVGYLSTTGVYGDTAGAWVDEDTPPNPARGRSADRLVAENEWRATGLPVHIFRLAGIYGPGRGPFQKVKDGTARRILKDGQIFSRIHVEDIAQALAASMARPTKTGRIYNICDNEAAAPETVLEYAADLLGLPHPPAIRFEDANLPPMARSFYSETRRVDNRLMRQELGIDLLYPSYREGLTSILAAEQALGDQPL